MCLAVLVSLQCAAAAGTTPRIKPMDPKKRETIRAALQADVVKGSDAWQHWFGSACICAPQLWQKVKLAVDKNGIEIIPTEFTNPSEPGSKYGATFKGAESSRRLARAIFPLVAHGKVRLATDGEIRTFWAIIPFDDVEEPIFVVSSAKGDILIYLLRDPESRRYFVFFVEALRLR
jgi:hypothetical protein